MLILSRIMPLGGPFIFSDEYLYGAWTSALHRGAPGVPPMDVALGNWLYLRVYSLTFIGPGSFLVKARVLNAFFSALGAGMLTWALHSVEPTQKKLLSAVLASVFAVALLGTYAGYFIPDAPYFAVSCAWLYCIVRYARDRRVLLAVMAGVVGSVVTMVKGHGFLLLPATILAFVFIGINSRDWRKTGVGIISVVAVWLFCCSVISFTLGNDNDLNPMGGFYGSTASGILNHLTGYLSVEFVRLVFRYLAVLIVILGLPLLISFWLALTAVFRPRVSSHKATLLFSALVLCCVTGGFLLMSSVFTVAAVTPGSVTYDPYHSLGRLDGGRYYEDFALLAACVGIMGSHTVLKDWSEKARLAIFVLFCMLLTASWWVLRGVGWQNPNDFAIAYGLFSSPAGRYWAFSLAAAGAFVSMLQPRHAPAVLTCALLAWMGFNVVRTEQLRWPNQESAAGRVAAMVSAASNRSATVEVAGPGATVDVYRAAFHLLDRKTTLALGNAASSCGVDGKMPDWVVTVDGTPDPCRYSNEIRIDDASAAQHR